MLAMGELRKVLSQALDESRKNCEGQAATYIPELANAPLEETSAAVVCSGSGAVALAGDHAQHQFTYQSSAKLLVLTGLLEERGPEAVFRVVGKEPSGGSFASVARLETHGPKPANPLINSGAIALCGQLEGNLEDRIGWILGWAEKLYGKELPINQRVLYSERRTGDRNRSIAYLLKTGGILEGDVEEVLEAYFSLCSIEGSVSEAARFAAVLAAGGRLPGSKERLLSQRTAATVVALMTTCGMYDESGGHLVETGLPAKSGVSGVIVAVSPGRAGIAVANPRLNDKGGSCRGHHMLRYLSRTLGWHVALPEENIPGGDDDS